MGPTSVFITLHDNCHRRSHYSPIGDDALAKSPAPSQARVHSSIPQLVVELVENGGGRTTLAPTLNPISRALCEWLARTSLCRCAGQLCRDCRLQSGREVMIRWHT